MLYFVSYAKLTGYGSMQIDLDKEICNIRDIKLLEEKIMENQGLDAIAILYWRRFEEASEESRGIIEQDTG